MSKERVNQLTAIGFDWDPFASAWEENFRALEQYKAKYSDCNVPNKWPEKTGLGRWVAAQRAAKIKGQISKERVNMLTVIGFDWDPFASAWEENFRSLEQYKVEYGDCNVLSKWPKNPSLANWVVMQRSLKIKGQLSKERVNRLTVFGFEWDPFASAWEENFHSLKQYKAKHGDCNVPNKWHENPGLGNWVSKQRAAKCKGQLLKAQVNKLTSIGLAWDPIVSAWEENFRALWQYKTKHRDCNVPAVWYENPGLGIWVSKQRSRKIKGQLSKEQLNKLTEIGFDWDPLASVWDENFRALEQYKATHGDCNVPQKWPKNPGLGRWVSKQREAKIKGQLSTERVNRLTALGLEWHRYRER